MTEETPSRKVLGDVAARQLANTTKTAVQATFRTARWLPRLLSGVPVDRLVAAVRRPQSGTWERNRARQRWL